MSISKYRVSEQAISDSDDIWIYTLRKWSKEQANRYYDLIIIEIEFIAENYLTGKPVEQTRENYSVAGIKSHLTFCRKIDDQIKEIIRILHQRMDIKKCLK